MVMNMQNSVRHVILSHAVYRTYLGVFVITTWAVNYFCCLFQNKINSVKISLQIAVASLA